MVIEYVVAFIGGFIIYVYKTKPVSGPAAVGLGLVAITAILALGLKAIDLVDDLFAFADNGIAFYAVMSFLLVIGMLLLAGYSASKTFEDTATMNVKIVMAIGLIPFMFINFISFATLSLWFIFACLLVYIPTIWAGHLLFNYHVARISRQ